MRTVPASRLVIHSDGSIFHLHLRPEQLADRVVLIGDPARVTIVVSYLDSQEHEISSREFHTITGQHKGKRIAVVSHGISTDNIGIVLNELDALTNIDFSTRTIKPEFKQLSLVRIGTSEGLQPSTPIGTYAAAGESIGLDGIIYFYTNSNTARDTDLESELIKQLDWRLNGIRPYVVSVDPSLIEQVICNDIIRGTTIAADGFYGPQGRELRSPLADPELNRKIEAFNYNGRKTTDFEMKNSSLAGLTAFMGHRAMTVCCIIAGHMDNHMNTDYKGSLGRLIETVLDRI